MHIYGFNMGQVKKANRVSILRYINQMGAVSRKDIADATGLTAAAVTQICNDFIAEGVLGETGEMLAGPGAGRKKVLIDIKWDFGYVIGINIEPEQTVIVISDLAGSLVTHKTIKTDNSIEPEIFLSQIADICNTMIDDNEETAEKLVAVSVGITGIVDRDKGVSVRAYGIWDREVEVCKFFKRQLRLPCFIENNVNAFSMAENIMGLGKQYDNLLVVKWGPGVGSSIIVDGEIYEGRHGKAAEIGHVIVEPRGEDCNCGRRGCLETMVNYHALKEIVNFEPEHFDDVFESVKNSDEKEKLLDVINIFARTLVNAATVLAPNRVVLCGPLFKPDNVRKFLIKACKNYDDSFDENRILYTSLGDREDYIGPVASYVYQKILLQ